MTSQTDRSRRRPYRRGLLGFGLLAATVLVFACTSDVSLIPVNIQALSVAPASDTLVLGDSTTLHAVGLSERGVPFVQPGVVWSTGNASIATVSSGGTVKAVGVGTVTITADLLGLTATGEILVTPRPSFVTTKDSVGFSAIANGPVPASQFIAISNGGGGSLMGITVDSISYVGTGGWLGAVLSVGAAPDTLTLVPNTSALTVGGHSATVFVSAPKANNSPRQIKVTYAVSVGVAASIALDSGAVQTAQVNTAVPIRPVVIVRDAFGNPTAGVSVTFAVTSGGGAVTPATAVTTDAAGRARATTWTLGTVAGANTLAATSGTLTGSPITFNATGTAAAATQIAKNGGDAQSSTVGAAVPTPPSVRVTDQFGNPVAGIAVTFAAASGGGSATGTSRTTDATGVATVGSWTLGTTAGANTMTATSLGLAGSPLTFSATGTAGAATQISKTAGDGQSATVATNVAIVPSATVRDQFGNGVSGVAVSFGVASGGGSVNPATPVLTNAAGVAQVTSWTLGTVAGANSLTATSGALTGSPLTFTATGTAGAATTIAKTGGDAQADTISRHLPIPLTVRVTDAQGNSVSGVTVNWAGTGGATLAFASSITNASGVATDTLILGTTAGPQGATATVSGLSGSPLSFTATATHGNATTLTLSAGNAQTDTIGATLATTYAVRVADRASNAVNGVTVNWAAPAGSITASSVTAGNGIASATRTLGTTAGAQPSTATVAGLTGSPVAFSATATAGNAVALALNAGNAQTDTIGTVLPTLYSVRLTDRAANPIAGATVNWVATGGSITPTSLTNASGIASATRTLGNTAGPQTATGTAAALPGAPVGFTATATHGNAATLAKNGGDNQSATVGTAVSTAPSAIVTDRGGNVVPGIAVTFAASAGNGVVNPATPILTNAAGIAQLTSWTLGAVAKTDSMTATSAGLSGSPQLFTAGAFSGSAAIMAMNGGNAQADTIGATLAVQYSVLITDNSANPVSGIPVSWNVTGGGGSITPTSMTNGSGIAVATRVLGTAAGAQAATASVGGLIGSPVPFTATALVGQAKNIAVSGGNTQSATVNTTVAIAPSALVTDRAGNPVSGVSVTFAVTGGGGAVNPITAILTNPSGVAQATSWTMGTVAGTSNNTLSATSGGLTGSPLAFTASALAGTPTQIAVNAGNLQSATVNTAVTTPPSVLIRDVFNNPVPSVNVTFAVTGGGGAVNPITVIATNASGVAQVTSWTLGTVAGTNNNTLSASAAVPGSPVGFTASALAGTPTQIAVNAGNLQSATVNTAVPTPPSVLVRDVFNNPVPSVNVTFAVTGGGGAVNPISAIATNASGVAQVTSWTLGTVAGTNNNTLSASAAVPGSPVGFTASALAGTPTQIAVNAGNLQSATVNTAVPTPPSVLVRDVFNNPVPGVNVTFAVTGGGGAVNPISAIATNASGVAQVTSWTLGITAGTNNNTLSASAAVPGSPVGFTASANAGVVSASQSTVAAGTAFITACSAGCVSPGTASVITVTARDQFANVIQGASVTISSSGTSNTFAPAASGSTSIAGVFTATFNSSTAQAKTVSAIANGVGITQTAAVTVNAAAANLANSLISAVTTPITACSTSCIAGSTASTINVTIRDAFLNPVPSALVTPSCLVGSNCTFAPPSGFTNASGLFTTNFNSQTAEAKTLRAAVSGVGTITPTAGVTVNAAAPASVIVQLNQGLSARVGTNVATRPTYLVRDAFLNPVIGQAVSITSQGGGGSMSPLSGFTNGSGQFTPTSWFMGSSNADDALGRMPNTAQLTAGSFSATATDYGIFTLSGDVNPVVAVNCAGCHDNPISLAYVGVISSCGNPYVQAGNANNSFAYLLLLSANCSIVQMPQGGPFFGTAQQKIVRAWINNGALNN